jgi:glutaminyl-tRNA synthetase
VRLRHGYCITCDEVVEERPGEVVELRCHHVPDSVGTTPPGLEVSGVVHWVSADHGVPAEVRLYDRLFTVPHPEYAERLPDVLNPESLVVLHDAVVEPSLADAEPGSRWQLERVGYFVADAEDSRPDALVLNRIVTLRDSWQERAAPGAPRPATEPVQARSAKSKTRPPKRTRAEYRAEARVRDELLAERFARWQAELGLSEADADLVTGDRATADLFAAAVAAGAPGPAVARWIVNELPRELGDRQLADTPMTGEALGQLVVAAESGAITGPAAKEVFAELVERGGDPARIIADRGLDQVADEGALAAIVDRVVAENPDSVERFRAGKTALLGFFVGQVLKASDGKADPQVVRKVLAERLG